MTNNTPRLLTATESERITLAKKALLEEFGWHEADFDGMRFTDILTAYESAETEGTCGACTGTTRARTYRDGLVVTLCEECDL